MFGVGSSNFINKDAHLVLTVIWQAVLRYQTKSIQLQDCNEIFRLLKEGEEVADLLKLTGPEILIRWINYHLKEAGQDREIKNLGADLADSFALTHVLNQIDSGKCSLDPLAIEDPTEKADSMIT